MGFPLSTDPRSELATRRTPRMKPTAQVKPYATPIVPPQAPAAPGNMAPMMPKVIAPPIARAAPAVLAPPPAPMPRVAPPPVIAKPPMPAQRPMPRVAPPIPAAAGGMAPVSPAELRGLFGGRPKMPPPAPGGLADGGTVASADPGGMGGFDFGALQNGAGAATANLFGQTVGALPDQAIQVPGPNDTPGPDTVPGSTNGGSAGPFGPGLNGNEVDPGTTPDQPPPSPLSGMAPPTSATAPGNPTADQLRAQIAGNTAQYLANNPGATPTSPTPSALPPSATAVGQPTADLLRAQIALNNYKADPSAANGLAWAKAGQAAQPGDSRWQDAINALTAGNGLPAPHGGASFTGSNGNSVMPTGNPPPAGMQPVTKDDIIAMFPQLAAQTGAASPSPTDTSPTVTTQGPGQSPLQVLSSLSPNRSNRFQSNDVAPNFWG